MCAKLKWSIWLLYSNGTESQLINPVSSRTIIRMSGTPKMKWELCDQHYKQNGWSLEADGPLCSRCLAQVRLGIDHQFYPFICFCFPKIWLHKTDLILIHWWTDWLGHILHPFQHCRDNMTEGVMRQFESDITVLANIMMTLHSE